ncbi:MAG: membrane protein insertion efficiency factor YidD [Opitutales bacterium]|nr:membrane protein insertion efficiency factor YidD [Opitutales bacterium]
MKGKQPIIDARTGRASTGPSDPLVDVRQNRGTPTEAAPTNRLILHPVLRAVRCAAARAPRFAAIFLVRVYQYTVSPALHWISPGGGCRFHPTCSEYSVGAFRAHGFVRGCWLTLRRILRCHPWGGAGYDPVPPAGPPPEKSRPPVHHPPCGRC